MAMGRAWMPGDRERAGIPPKRRAGAVWFGGAMGLLDDAIREHLELKRLRGADPGDVAREEQDALGPVRREGDVEQDGQRGGETEAGSEADESFSAGAGSSPAVDSSEYGQETVEINMEVELGGKRSGGHESDTGRAERAAPVAHPAHNQDAVEESLEWEVPGDRSEEPADAVEGEGEGACVADEDAGGEHVEDVLEETPDFLRDTPEQERLWFEQRPPRDFDFNE